jgi:hypothetical protein
MTTKFDNVLRYHVTSRSRTGVEHVVDLELYDGNGACSCENFTYRLEPALKAGAKPGDSWRCRHIREARARLTDDIVRQAAESMKGKKR